MQREMEAEYDAADAPRVRALARAADADRIRREIADLPYRDLSSPEEQIREALHAANVRGDRNEAAKLRLRLADLDRGRLVSMGGAEPVRGLVILLDTGDGHGPLPRFAKSDGRFAKIKIGRRSWNAMPNEAQPNYIGKHAIGGNAALFGNDRMNWTVGETTAPRRPASAPPKRLSEDEKLKVDQIVLSLTNSSFPRSVKSIVKVLLDLEGNVEGAWWDDSSPHARWVKLMGEEEIDSDARYSSAAAETMVRSSLARSEKIGKLVKVEGGWLRA